MDLGVTQSGALLIQMPLLSECCWIITFVSYSDPMELPVLTLCLPALGCFHILMEEVLALFSHNFSII